MIWQLRAAFFKRAGLHTLREGDSAPFVFLVDSDGKFEAEKYPDWIGVFAEQVDAPKSTHVIRDTSSLGPSSSARRLKV
jgi:hypothetical protein